MQYHDNEVTLLVSGGYSLVSGSYTVESFSVSSGEDPRGNIRNGLQVSFGSNGKMSFSVGRSGSDVVAKWFNDRVPASRNTFNHSADKLNFAFLGTLKMTITGGIFGRGQNTFTFAQIALAQGHAGASNNWWFGGPNCAHIQSDQVSCQSADSKGTPFSFVFLRGGIGNDVSTVEVKSVSVANTAAWMSRVDNSRTLDQLVLPGSHDSGMSELHHCAPPGVGDPYTQTQGGSIAFQLSSGARYFDIRVDWDHGELVTYHRSGALGCNGQSLKAVLDETRAFLGAQRTETVILKFSHIRNYEDHNAASTKQKINDFLNGYASVIYTNANAGTNLARVRLGDARGRMILVFDYDEFINPGTGRFRYKDGSTIQSGANITVYDEYSDTYDYETMKSGQLQKWKDYGGLGTGRFFLLSWTLTSSKPPLSPSIESLAGIANSRLPGVLHDQIVAAGASKPNIVYIDYVASTVCQSIILYNNFEAAGPIWTKIGDRCKGLAADGGALYCLSLDDSIWRYDGAPDRWTQIGARASQVVASARNFYCVNSDNQAIWKYNGAPHNWTKIGDRCKGLAGDGDALYCLSTDNTIWRYDGAPDRWTQIGVSAVQLAASGGNLYCVNKDNLAIWRYNRAPHNWTKVGDRCKGLAADGGALYCISTDDTIWRYDGAPDRWTRIGDRCKSLAADGGTLYCISTSDTTIWKYNGQPNNWTKVGDRALAIVADNGRLTCISTTANQIWQI